VIEIKSTKDWQSIGNVGFFNLNQHDRSAEIGIFIGEKKYWDQGYGIAAMQLMLKHGFEDLNLNRIYLTVYDTNPRAIRAYEKAGFILEGCLRQERFLEGRYVDALLMSVILSEWKMDKEDYGGGK